MIVDVYGLGLSGFINFNYIYGMRMLLMYNIDNIVFWIVG